MHKHVSYTALIVALVALLVVLLNPKNVDVIPKKETAFERVMRTHTLRCGYDVWPPIIMHDETTGQLSGIFYDYMETLANNLGLKIEWVKGITYASYISDLHYDRIDAMCAGVWPVGEIIDAVDFTRPLYYLPINAYVRADDVRFDHDLSVLNNKQYAIADIDGLVPARIARENFPDARTVSLPPTSPTSDMLLSVAMGKADVTFTDPLTAASFAKTNPNKLKLISTPQPIRVFGNTMAVAKDDGNLLRMLDNATEEIRNSGVIEKVLQKYEPAPGTFIRVAAPYALPLHP